MTGFFDHIKHIRPIDSKAFWVLSEIFDDLGVTNTLIQNMLVTRIPKWLNENGIHGGKLFKDLDDWMVTEMGLYGVVGTILLCHGNKDRIMAAKIAFGLMLPPPPIQTALPVPVIPEPVEVIHTPLKPGLATVAPLPPVFSYNDKPVRTEILNGEIWFVAKDVCDVLGFRMASDATRTLDEDERGTHTVRTPSGDQEMLIINEPGLYSLILRSRKPEAKLFKRWITHQVIPAIRKTGSYSAQPVRALPTDYKSALVQLLEEVSKNEALEAKVVELHPKAQFHDAVADATNCHTFIEAAKILGTGQNRLYAWCREKGYLMSRGTMPYQRHIDSGHFKLIESPYEDPKNGETKLSYKTLITGKGLALIQKKWAQAAEAA